MERQKKLVIAIIVVAAIGIGAVIWGTFLAGPDLSAGDKSILVLAVDESEPRPGMGAVDMAFMVELKDGSIANYTPIYPSGLRHPTQAEPAEAQAQGAGAKMLLHDSLWDTNTEQGMSYAKEIVEHNEGVKVDAVVAVNTEALDAIISSAGEIEVNGEAVDLKAIDLVRENDELHGGTMSRGDAVMALASALSEAANNGANRDAMIQAALDQYSKGNIVMVPGGSFMGLMASKGIESITG
ncbi:hypothetical protein MBCUT_15670 [Methanobrevibacter cuticularis]|uniref:DUF4012 domain-containing protein n=1 Tax=Methanobrevibacter cuticularis TaxID=47311 RepID=A0A166D8S0_9EURY|nr:DUF4012 domain-containing protein [Methanobrevibacter cuticularis]KZX15326.1 hypothetical protein MBCUT_15670 [Methanobrevibacter cuticularis]